MITPTKVYKNWPSYEDDLTNKIYVDLAIEDAFKTAEIDGKIDAIKEDLEEAIDAQAIINNDKLDRTVYDTFIDEEYNPLVETVDKKIESFSQTTDPADTWSTAVEKETHLGDIWYNEDIQKTYIYKKNTSVSPTVYYWQWQNVPVDLINNIDSKSTIYSGIIPSNYLTGDFWIIPLDCYSNSSNLISSETGFSEGMQITLGAWILTVISINVDTTINEYSLNIPNTSNYDISETITTDNLEIEIISTSSFVLPTDSFGGEVCMAVADGTAYDSADWIKRSNYIPNDMASIQYSTKVEVNNKIIEERTNTSSSIQNLNDSLVFNVNTINTTIEENKVTGDLALDELDDYTHTNINQLIEDTDDLDTYISEVNATLSAQLQLLNDAIINTVKSTGGNNLLRNSVGFKDTTYWNVISGGVMQQFIQSIATKITISFKYRKVGVEQALIRLHRDTTNYDTLLDTSIEVLNWTEVEYSYTSIVNNSYLFFNSEFVGVQDNDAESNGTSKSKLVFDNGLVITDLMINYGDKQPWSPYFDEIYGKSHKLDAYGLELLDLASMNKSALDSNSLDFVDSNDVIQGVFSKVETKSDNYYANNSINIGNLNIVKLDDDNILEY